MMAYARYLDIDHVLLATSKLSSNFISMLEKKNDFLVCLILSTISSKIAACLGELGWDLRWSASELWAAVVQLMDSVKGDTDRINLREFSGLIWYGIETNSLVRNEIIDQVNVLSLHRT